MTFSSAIGEFIIGESPIGVIELPSSHTFPPDAQTTITKIIRSYLYKQYDDDEDLQAFVDAQNMLAQQIADWFVSIGLPVYTGTQISGLLLEWVIAGLYGIPGRPALPSGTNQNIGPLNTWVLNSIPLNTLQIIGNQNYYATTDDVFKRILTWHFFKGDGKYFTIRWLKRRVMRFLVGDNGTAPDIDQTYLVSVTFGVGNQVNINIDNGTRTVTRSALLNTFALNEVYLDQLDSTFVSEPPFPLASVFKAAVESGVLELPFQFDFVVNIT